MDCAVIMKNFLFFPCDHLREKFRINLDIYVSKRKKYEHLVLNKFFFLSETRDQILNYAFLHFEKSSQKKEYEIYVPRLIHSIRWRYDYFIFWRKLKKIMSRRSNDFDFLNRFINIVFAIGISKNELFPVF